MLVIASASGLLVIGLAIAVAISLVVWFLRLEDRGEREEQAEREAADDGAR